MQNLYVIILKKKKTIKKIIEIIAKIKKVLGKIQKLKFSYKAMTFFLSSWFKNVSDDFFYFNIILDLMNIHSFF